MNDQIRISPVRVIDQEMQQLGVMPVHAALTLAREAGLDLVEVGPTERPPVCRIMDYGKHKYLQKKRQKGGQHGHQIMLKEIRLRPSTGEHDRMIKVAHAREFLGQGHKVQFNLKFRGRERFHREVAFEAFNGIITELSDVSKVERPPSMESGRMIMVLVPGKGGAKAPAPQPVLARKAAGSPSPPGAIPGEAGTAKPAASQSLETT